MAKTKAKPSGRKKLLVGITGGIGAGKSLVASVYREAGYPVFSADVLAREVVAKGSPALAEIAGVFGPTALLPDGTLNRAELRDRISRDPALRLRLEAITHPRIQERSQALAAEAFAAGAEIVFYEAPLLFEAKSDRAMDKVICVHAPEEKLLERTMKRDSSSREAAERLLRSQMPQEKKMRKSHFLIANEGSEAELRAAALAVLEKLKSG